MHHSYAVDCTSHQPRCFMYTFIIRTIIMQSWAVAESFGIMNRSSSGKTRTLETSKTRKQNPTLKPNTLETDMHLKNQIMILAIHHNKFKNSHF